MAWGSSGVGLARLRSSLESWSTLIRVRACASAEMAVRAALRSKELKTSSVAPRSSGAMADTTSSSTSE